MNIPLIHKEEGNHPVEESRKKLTVGQRAADRMSSFLGSWGFIIFFTIFLILWIIVNVVVITFQWDPYPFILLNLALSSLAALQAPIIMMSQNRQADRDRIAAQYDYAVNRKTEREVQEINKYLEEIKNTIKELKK